MRPLVAKVAVVDCGAREPARNNHIAYHVRAQRKIPQGRDDEERLTVTVELARQCCYRKIAELLRRVGSPVNDKRSG